MNRPFSLLLAASLLAGCSSTQAVTPSPSQSTGSPSSAVSQEPATPGSAASSTPSAGGTPAPGVCRDPHEHVYNPDRLHLVDPCMIVSGRVEAIRSEADGDYHILLRLDPAFANLVNNANLSSERGDLVLEPVCEIRVTQRDAVQACSGVGPSVPRPTVGVHYSATGAYVLDQVHGWMELHPLWDLHES